MDPNLIAKILARARQGPGLMGNPYEVQRSSAPVPPQDPQNFYAAQPSPIQGRQMPPMQSMMMPNREAEQALGSQPGAVQMNPLIRQIMQHLGMLNLIRNQSAQPFMAQTQGY